MIVKKKTSPKPTYAESVAGVVRPLRCTTDGELLMHQANNPDPLNELVKFLQNVKFDVDGAILTRQEKPIDVTLKKLSVNGTVDVGNTVTVKPVTVANMPRKIEIQEPLRVQQIPVEAKIMPISFEGYGSVILDESCKIYSIYLTVCDVTWVEIPGIAGKMWIKEFKLDLFPFFVKVDKLTVAVQEWSKAGGYAVYEI